MKRILVVIVSFLFSFQILHSQEDGVVSFSLPIRNSLKFNKYIINPTFSFVREQNPYFSIYNKREWTQFENPPQTYLFSYSGRFRENEAMAIGLFQQNYGVMTTFGGVVNYAHNVELRSDSNLTFGINVGFYKSGLNDSKIITNYPDPSLNSIPSNMILTVNPGINYGLEFLDFGLSFNNLVSYNIKNSKMIEEDPQKGIEAHVMYTGYIDSFGFFDRSKFSGLLKAASKKDQTIVSGLVMFSVPIGIWSQAGYNSLHGVSAGIGMNVTQNISLEYNFEKGMGNMSNFGSSHEFVLAYKFKYKNYDYGDENEEASIITPVEYRKVTPIVAKLTPEEKAKKEQQSAEVKARRAEVAQAKLDAIEKAKALADAKNKANVLTPEKIAAQNKAKSDAIASAKLAAEAKASADALAKAKLATTAKIKADALAKEKLAAAQKLSDEKAKADALAAAQKLSDEKAKADALAAAQKLADEKAKADALAASQKLADEKAKADALAAAQKLADEKAKADALAAAQKLADEKAKADALAASQKLADEKAKADALAAAQKLSDEKAKADALAAAQKLADEKAKADAVAAAQKLADEKAKADALAAAQKLADEKAKADAVAAAQKLADEKAKADVLAAAQKLADEKAKADALAASQKLADEKSKADALAAAQKLADEKAKADALAAAQKLADEKAKADAVAAAQKLADEKAKADALAAAQKLADEKAKADALAAAQKLADEKAKADALAAAQKLADAKAKADALAAAQKLADEKAKADAVAAAQKLADEKAKADAVAAAQKLADEKAKADAVAAAQKLADEKAKADALAAAQKLEDEKAKAAALAKDEYAKSMDNIAVALESSKKTQQQLLINLNATVSAKEKDLQEMKEENDLSDKGIFKAPKPFKSTAGENAALESLNVQIAAVNKVQSDKIKELEGIYNLRIKKVSDKNDQLNQYYLKTIETLKTEQSQAIKSNQNLVSSLEKIKIATEVEKTRRIKRASFVNAQDRLSQDKATLKRIKETTPISAEPLKPSDFDFGEEQSNMQILNGIKEVPNGFYLVVAVHSDVAKRDAFLKKAVAAGQTNINFFYDVSSSKYYIYYDKFDSIEEAKSALLAKGSMPYNGKMSISKIEN